MKRLRASPLIRTNAGSSGPSNTVFQGLDQQVVQAIDELHFRSSAPGPLVDPVRRARSA